MADEEAQVLRESKKWAWPDRVAHSNWKVRSSAYDDIRVACTAVYEETDPCLTEFAGLFNKAVADSNAAAQDKALDALNTFLIKANEQLVSKYVDKVVANIVGKALNGRTGTVQRATEALLCYIELEQSSAVVDGLLAGLKNKVPKIVVASIDVLVQAISLFGVKVIIPQPVIKATPAVADSKDGKAREKAKELVVELSRWVGPEVIRSALFKDMRDAMKEEIDRGMQEVAALGRPKPERFTRKEQARQAALRAQQEASGAPADAGGAAADSGGAAAAAVEEVQAEVDPYEFAEPRDVLKDLKKEWGENLEAKKWSDRKGSLTQLKELCTYPRLASGRDVDYGDVNRELRKVITKDSNVACVAEAIACTGAMAQGLRAAFSATAKNLVEVLLEKYKEKNAAVGKAVSEALAAMHKHCWSLLDVAENLTVALGHSNPKVKEETLVWLTSEVGAEAKPALSKLAPLLLAPAAKCAEEATPSLREAALRFMVTFATKFGNFVVLDKFTTKMDDGRKKRLEEMRAEAAGPAAGGPGAGVGLGGRGAAGAAPAPAAAGPTSPVTLSKARPSAAAAALAASRSKPGTAATAKVPLAAAAGTGKVAAGTSAVGAKKGAAGKEPDDDDEASLAAGSMSRDEAVAKLGDLIGEAAIKQLKDEQWKARLEAMDSLAARAAEGSLAASCTVVVQAMGHLPGWSEKNFQVMAKQFEVVRVLADTAPNFSKRDGYAAVCGLIEKVADMKLKGPSFDALMAISEALSPAFTATLLHKKAAVHKNPKILSEVLNWVAQATAEFGLGSMNVKALIDWAKEDLASTNAGVRNSAIHLLGVMHRFLGPPLGDMIRADVKPALMAAIDGEFAKNPKDPGFTPSRTSRADLAKREAAGAAGTGSSQHGRPASGSNIAEGAGGYDMDELMPRADISAAFTPALLESLGGSNWKDRKQAMDNVEAAITSAGGRIQPQVGDLIAGLKPRMTDSNKNLGVQALGLLASLAKAMGKPIDRAARALLAPALKNLSDNKANVRAAVCEMLTAWVSVAPVDSLMPDFMEALLSPKCTADGRADGLAWLASLAETGKASSQLPDCMKALALGSMGGAGAALRSSTTRLPVGGVRTSLTLNKSQHLASGMAAGGRGEAAAEGPLILMDSRKEDRARKGKYRPAKLEIRPDEAPTLEAEFSPLLSSHLKSLMFHKDFKKHCEAADAVREALPGMYDEVMSVLDLLFRWSTLRIAEANTQVLVKVLDMLKEVMAAMEAADHRLSEYEAKLILPVLVEKAGHNQDKIKADHRELMRRAALIYPPVKVAAFVKDGLDSKNNKTRVACAEELGAMIDRSGQSIYRASLAVASAPGKSGGPPPESMLAGLARQVAERDNALRSAALASLEVVYAFEGEGLWRHLPKVVDPAKSLIEERLKYTDKQLAKQGVRAGYRCEPVAVDDHPGLAASSLNGLAPDRRSFAPPAASSLPLSPGLRPASPSMPSRASHLPSASALPPPQAFQAATQGSVSYSAGAGAGGGASILAGLQASLPYEPAAQRQSGGGALLAHESQPAPAASDTAAALAFLRQSSNNLQPAMWAGATAAAGQGPAAGPRLGQAMPGQGGAAPPMVALSPMTGLSKGSEVDMRRDFRRCLQELAGPEMEESVQVMKVLCYELMDVSHVPAVHALFKENIDELVALVALKTDEIFAMAGDAIACNQAPNARACKYALNTLMNIMQAASLAQAMREATVCPMVSVLLCCLIDERLGSLPEGLAMLKALNLLMMKVLENCDRTAVFGALMHLLRVPHQRLLSMGNGDKALEGRWFDLVVKCMIKITKSLPATIETIDLHVLLLAVHKFFDALGGEEIRRRGAREDKPLRMVKTVLHEVCKLKGSAIHDYTRTIPGADLDPSLRPIIFPYIDLNLQTMAPNDAAARAAYPAAPRAPAPSSQAAAAAAGIPPAAQPPSRPPLAIPPSTVSQAPPSHVLAVSTNALNVAAGMQQQQQQQGGVPQAVHKAGVALAAATAAPEGGVPPAPVSAPLPIGPLAPSASMYSQQAVDEQAARNMLGAVFKRIAEQPPDRQQALIDLYFFSVANPDTDVAAMLASASSTFRSFILRGLQKIKAIAEQQQQQKQQQQQQQQQHGVESPDATVSVAANVRDSVSQAAMAASGAFSAAVPTPAGGVAVLMIAKLRTDSFDASQGPVQGGAASPASPGMGKAGRVASVVGAEKMAEMRDRFNRMTSDMASMPSRQSTSVAGSLNNSNLVSPASSLAGAPPSHSFAPASDAGQAMDPALPSFQPTSQGSTEDMEMCEAEPAGLQGAAASGHVGFQLAGNGNGAGSQQGQAFGRGMLASGGGLSAAAGHSSLAEQGQSEGDSGLAGLAGLQERLRKLKATEA
ncbi:armadillo-type protein [Haematococcus lacustris]